MSKLKTKNYFQKRVVNFLFNEKGYNKIKLYKIIFDYKIKKPYEISKILSDLVSSDNIIFDIGANMGQFACRLNDIVKKGSGQVYSFEPVSENFISLNKMKKILKMGHVSLFKLGVSNVNQTSTINIPMYNNGLIVGTRASLININDDIKFKTEEIKVTTIDTFFNEQNLKKVNFIKCDTEGNEINVLKGGEQTIKKHLPTLCLEIEVSHNSDSLNWLLELGYIFFFYDSLSNNLKRINDNNQKGDLIAIHSNNVEKLHKIIEN